MSEELLKNILNGKIDIDKCVEWLHYGLTQNEDIFKCSRADFTLYVLTYIRNQTESVLQFSSTRQIDILTSTKIPPKPLEHHEASVERKNSFPETQKRSSPRKSPMKTNPNGPVLINSRVSRRLSTELFPQSKDEAKHEGNVSKDDLKVLDNERIDTFTKRDDSSMFLTSFESDKNASKDSSKNESPVKNSSFDKECLFSPVTPANKTGKSNNITVSTPKAGTKLDLSFSPHSGRDLSELSGLHPQHANIIQMNPNIGMNPAQPTGFQHRYHVQRTQTFFPTNPRDFQNFTTNARIHNLNYNLPPFMQPLVNSSFRTSHNTSHHHPQQDYQNSFKPTSNRTNICIGDFIVGNKSATSDKATGKKKRHSKFVNLSMDEGNMPRQTNTDHSSIDIKDTKSFPEIGAKQPSSRRRINPTRLNITDPELNTSLNSNNQGAVRFGVKYDKAERNEAFNANVFQPKEQASSFNMERNLLKKEKEKLLQKFNSLTNPESVANTSFNNSSKPAIQIKFIPATQTSTFEIGKKAEAKLNFTAPDFKLVQNCSALECIALLYSTMLDCNLIVNVTSEIHFLISLLVAQQIDTTKGTVVNHFGKLLIKDEVGHNDTVLSDFAVLNESEESLENSSDRNICSFEDLDSSTLEQSISALKITEDGKNRLDLSKITENTLALNNESALESRGKTSKTGTNLVDKVGNHCKTSGSGANLFSTEENHCKTDRNISSHDSLKVLVRSEDLAKNDSKTSQINANKVKKEPDATQKSTTAIDLVEEDIDLGNLFSTVHNCVYFALCTLKHQIFMLDIILDQAALRLLQENTRVRSFSPALAEHFAETYAVKSTVKQDLDVQSGILNKNVCFNTDTDSMENFPSQQSFYAFKKQRDLFYDIFRVWESSHNKSNWNFSLRLGGMMRTLLSLGTAPSNYAHLARLFREQLLNAPHQAKIPDSLADLEWGKVSAERLSKLAERLTTKGVSSEETFPHHQEFFRDFLILADNGPFRQHLADSLTEEICRLDQTAFLSSENDDTDMVVDLSTRLQYLQCVRSLQILAKFLGFLLALPYGGNTDTPREQVLNSEVAVRDQTQPPMDLLSILQNSRKNQRLVLTVPWMVHLLSMMDYTCLRLTYYKNLTYCLFQIYADSICVPVPTTIRNNSEMDQNWSDFLKTVNSNVNISANARILLRICLGWLFDMAQFPQEFFYGWLNELKLPHIYAKENPGQIKDSKQGEVVSELNIAESNSQAIKGDPEMIDKLTMNFNEEFNKQLVRFSIPDGKADSSLDRLELVDGNLILAVCPFLKELKTLLSSNRDASSGENNRTFRHITPLTSSFADDNSKHKDKQIQLQLEEWFLRSQSTSTCRAVGERVGAALVKLLRAQLGPLRAMASQGTLQILKDPATCNPKSEIHALHVCLMRTFRRRALELARPWARTRCYRALRGLLPPGTRGPALTAMGHITARKALQALNEWLNVHVDTITADLSADIPKIKLMLRGNAELRIFRKSDSDEINEYISIADKKDVIADVDKLRKAEEHHTESVKYHSATDIVIDMKELCIQLVASKSEVQTVRTSLEDQLQRGVDCSRCQYIQASSKRTIGQLCVDISMLIVTLHPSLLTQDALSKFGTIWRHCLFNKIPAEDVITLPFSPDENNSDTTSDDEVEQFQKQMFGDVLPKQIKSGSSFNKNCVKSDKPNESMISTEDENPFENVAMPLRNDDTSVSNETTSASNESTLDNDEGTSVGNDHEVESNGITNEFFDTILCPRNVMFLGRLGNGSQEVWNKLAELLKFLLKEQFLTEDSLTEQCLAIYRQDWPQSTLEKLSACMRALSEGHALSSGKLKLLLDFLAEFCQNLGEMDFML